MKENYTFPEKQKLKELITVRPALQELKKKKSSSSEKEIILKATK